MGNKPDRIWATGLDTNGSWSRDEPPGDWDAGAAAYVRADLYDALRAQVEAMREALSEIMHFPRTPLLWPGAKDRNVVKEQLADIARSALSKTTGSPDGQA